MIRDNLRHALDVLGDSLPDGEMVLIVRRAFGDRAISFLRGDAERVTGHPARTFEASLSEWSRIVHDEDRQTVIERLGELPDREHLRLEYRVLQPDGGVRWLREELRVLRAGPGQPPEVVGVLTDVTDRRGLRARLSRVERELWRARKMESVGRMAGGVAHDFNNLLTVILASCDLMRQEELPAETLEEVKVVREAATRGMSLARQILTFAARTPGGPQPLDLAGSVRDLREILARILGERTDLELEVPEDVLTVDADQAHVEQVVLNLASNARDAMPGGGRLRIRVEDVEVEEPRTLERGRITPGLYVRIVVQDTGTGIDPDARARLFEPFYSTRADREGAGGFGLPTVLRIIQGYRGAIDIETEAGGGTAVHVYLPARDPEAPPARDLEALDSARGLEEKAIGLRILAVEDDDAVRSVVERVLARSGHEVVTVGSANEALRVFDRVRPPFDLLITDVMLPDRSGPDVHRALSRRVDALPVIFMSGYGRETAAREGASGRDAIFLKKPFSPGQLLQAVDRASIQVYREGSAGEMPDAEAGGR